jgi:hypothetical protein
MKKLIVLIVLFSILYFAAGFAAVLLGWFPRDTYLTFSGIIGGLASVCGLLSFGIARRISKQDFEDIEAAYLKRISETADTLKQSDYVLVAKMKQLQGTEEELKKLEIKKREMEFLVKKASMSLFLQDQFERNQKRILELVESNTELKKLLDEAAPLKHKLTLLEQEIADDPNVKLLNEIIGAARIEKQAILEFKTSFFGLGIDMKQLVRRLSRLMTS